GSSGSGADDPAWDVELLRPPARRSADRFSRGTGVTGSRQDHGLAQEQQRRAPRDHQAERALTRLTAGRCQHGAPGARIAPAPSGAKISWVPRRAPEEAAWGGF